MRNFIGIPYDKLVPTLANIIVKIEDAPKKIGSILTAIEYQDRMKQQHMVGTILSMGDLAFVYSDGMGQVKRQQVAVGDKVVFEPYAGQLAEDVDQPYRILPSAAVLAVIPKYADAFDKKPLAPTLPENDLVASPNLDVRDRGMDEIFHARKIDDYFSAADNGSGDYGPNYNNFPE